MPLGLRRAGRHVGEFVKERFARPPFPGAGSSRGELVALVSDLESLVARQEDTLASHAKALRSLQSWRARGEEDLPVAVSERPTATRGLEEDFYAGFEAELRGDQETVRAMLAPHLSLVADVEGTVLDLGAGRGEWLGLLGESGIPCYGVELSAVAVREARSAGLDVVNQEALSHLEEVEPGTLGAVTAFHLLEHLDFEAQMLLLRLTLRALRPGGRVVFETPNCENISVGATSFWLDPTHVRPLHPNLLEYMLSYTGFADIGITGLHPSADEIDEETLTDLADDPRRNGVLSAVARHLVCPRDYVATAIRP